MSNDIYPVAHPQGVEMVGLLLENVGGQPPTNDDCQGWVLAHDTPYPIFNNGMYDLLDELGQGGTIGLPLTYIIDANATIRYAGSGAIQRPYMVELLNDILATPYGPE